MNTEVKKIDTLLSTMGVRLPVELLSRLDVEELLDLEYQRRQNGAVPIAGKYALGNILVATGEITRVQLEQALLRQHASGRRLGAELIEAGHASTGQIDNGLSLQRKLIACALALTVALAPLAGVAPAAQAGQASATMSVSVRVIADTNIQTSFQLTQLGIVAADVARGYVEVAAGSRFSVQTSSQSGYLLEFHPVGNIYESVQVGGLGKIVQFGPEGGAIIQSGPLLPNLEHELSYRFTLRPDTLPGSYPWPLQLSVRALP